MIISSTIINQSPQIDGRKYVTEKHIDHTGREHIIEYLAEADADVDSILVNRVPSIEQDLKISELENMVALVLNGEPILPNHIPVYNTPSEIYAYLFNRFISETDPVVLLKAVNFIDLFTDEELTSYGLTSKQIKSVRDEADKIKQAAAILSTFQPLGG